MDDGAVRCHSHVNMITHSSLNLEFKGNEATAFIDFNGIRSTERLAFQCTGGFIKLDQKAFKKGMIKAEFELQFLNSLDESKPIYWNGVIATPVK
jgi:hypothetical protein